MLVSLVSTEFHEMLVIYKKKTWGTHRDSSQLTNLVVQDLH